MFCDIFGWGDSSVELLIAALAEGGDRVRNDCSVQDSKISERRVPKSR